MELLNYVQVWENDMDAHRLMIDYSTNNYNDIRTATVKSEKKNMQKRHPEMYALCNYC